MYERKLDDLDQDARRLSLVLHGISFSRGDTPGTLREMVIAELKRLGLSEIIRDVDRAHRYGRKQFSDGRPSQPVIVRFTKWHSRNELYQSRFKSKFIVQADLTHRRESLVAFAKKQQALGERAKAIVKTVGVDKNCALYAVSISGELFQFSSELEFHIIVLAMENSCLKIIELHKHLRTAEFGFTPPNTPVCYKHCCAKDDVNVIVPQPSLNPLLSKGQ